MNDEVWNLKDATPANAYQLGLMVADMVKAALDEAIADASAANVKAFRAGIEEGLRAANLLIDTSAWQKDRQNQGEKRRVIASLARSEPSSGYPQADSGELSQ